MTDREAIREDVLALVRAERSLQVFRYGHNTDLEFGFGGNVSDYPWLSPYTGDPNGLVEEAFRADYDRYERQHGNPTWMHLIREEVAEMFSSTDPNDIADEAIQVAALCVSLIEHIIVGQEGRDSGSND